MTQTPNERPKEETDTIDIDRGEGEALPPGISIAELMALAEEIDFPVEDLQEIANAVEELRRVDARGG
jgi:hypothetical protein